MNRLRTLLEILQNRFDLSITKKGGAETTHATFNLVKETETQTGIIPTSAPTPVDSKEQSPDIKAHEAEEIVAMSNKSKKERAQTRHQKRLKLRQVRDDYLLLLKDDDTKLEQIVDFIDSYQNESELVNTVIAEYKSVSTSISNMVEKYFSGDSSNEFDRVLVQHRIKVDYTNSIREQIPDLVRIPVTITTNGPQWELITPEAIKPVLQKTIVTDLDDFQVTGAFPLNQPGEITLYLTSNDIEIPFNVSLELLQAPFPTDYQDLNIDIDVATLKNIDDIPEYIQDYLVEVSSNNIEEYYNRLCSALSISYKTGYWQTEWSQSLFQEWQQLRETYALRLQVAQLSDCIRKINKKGPWLIPEMYAEEPLTKQMVIAVAKQVISKHDGFQGWDLKFSFEGEPNQLDIPVDIIWKGNHLGEIKLLRTVSFLPNDVRLEIMTAWDDVIYNKFNYESNTKILDLADQEASLIVNIKNADDQPDHVIRARLLAVICRVLLENGLFDELQFKRVLTSYYAAKGGELFTNDLIAARRYYVLFFRMLYQEDMRNYMKAVRAHDFPVIAAFFTTFLKFPYKQQRIPGKYWRFGKHERLGPQIKLLWQAVTLFNESLDQFFEALLTLYEIDQDFVRNLLSDIRYLYHIYSGFKNVLVGLDLESNNHIKNTVAYSLNTNPKIWSTELVLSFSLSILDTLDISRSVFSDIQQTFDLGRRFISAKDIMQKSALYTEFDRDILQVQRSVDQLANKVRSRNASDSYRRKLGRLRRFLNELEIEIDRVHQEFFKNARLIVTIESGVLPRGQYSPLELHIKNTDFGAASNLVLHIEKNPSFEALGYITSLGPIYGKNTYSEAIYLSPCLETPIELRGYIKYSDQESDEKVASFGQIIETSDPSKFKHFNSPYITGKPVLSSSMFYGRQKELEKIIQALKGYYQDRPTVIHGRRRIGKTSILLQLKQGNGAKLGVPLLDEIQEEYYPIIVDFERVSAEYETWAIYLLIYEKIRHDLDDFGIITDPVPLDEFREIPDIVLDRYMNHVGDLLLHKKRKLLLMFDEFDVLIIHKGEERGLFGFIRDLITKHEYISIIFVGADQLVEMMMTKTQRLYSMAVKMEIKDLAQAEAEQLIINPIKNANPDFRWADNAVKSIIHYAARHPYYIQILCDRIVNNLISGKRLYATVIDVEQGIKEIVSGLLGDLVDTVNELHSIEEKIILTCFSELTQHERNEYIWITGSELGSLIRRYTQKFDTRILPGVLRSLQQRYILDHREGNEAIEYCIRVPLLRLYLKNAFVLKDVLWEGGYT